MHRLKYALLILLLVWAAWQAEQVAELRAEAQDLATWLNAVESERAALLNELEAKEAENKILSRINSALREENEELRFKALDIPLDEALQEFTYYRAKAAGIDPNIVFEIMWRESRFQLDAVGYNTNGTRDVGLCQINEVNWGWLADEGIDVHTPEGNIRACIRILSIHMEKYPTDQAIAAYAVGESGMLNGGGVRYANLIMGGQSDVSYKLG